MYAVWKWCKRVSVVVLSALVMTTASAQSAGHAHVHGRALLQLSLQGQTLRGSFEIPMDVLLGYERAPRTAAEKKQLEQLQLAWKQPSHFIAVPAQAHCQPKPVTFSSALLSAKPEPGHSDLDYEFEFQCAQPQQLTRLELPVFKAYPRLKELRVEWVGPKGQRAFSVKASDPVITP